MTTVVSDPPVQIPTWPKSSVAKVPKPKFFEHHEKAGPYNFGPQAKEHTTHLGLTVEDCVAPDSSEEGSE